MKPFRLTLRARSDLRAIQAWITKDNPQAAVSTINGLYKAFSHLSDWPMTGRDCGEFRAGVRSFVHRDHMIYYRPTSAEVVIVRVIHGRRDRERLL